MTKKSSQLFASPEVRVVEASAGSGKTYALAKRYVQLILHPSSNIETIPIRNLLAITFTNKASLEMKSRILEFLKKIALQQLSSSETQEILDPIGVNRGEASQKAYAIMEHLIRHYNFFQVQTIDKFINALLSGCAFKIGLTANFKIKTNSREYLQRSLDLLIDRAYTEKQVYKIFEKFLDQYLYLENRSGWFPKQDMLSIIGSLFNQNNAHGHAFVTTNSSSEDLIKKKRQILKDIAVLREKLPEGTDKRFLNSIDKFLKANRDVFDVDSLSDYFARQDFPARKGTVVPQTITRSWNKIHKAIETLCEQEAYVLFDAYIHLFNHVMKEFYNLTEKDDILFLGELNKRAALLFDEDYITVEELYYRLAMRFHHYLIDEFQDTSRLQWHNLAQMVEEALSTGGTLFYVGDKKQAIYGFRGGDASLFDDIQNRFSPFNVRVEPLVKNYRSEKTIVEFNNKIFSIDNLKRFLLEKETADKEKHKQTPVSFGINDIATLSHVFESSQQTYLSSHSQGYVKIECIDIDKREQREEVVREKILNLLKGLNKRFSFREVALLTRSNSEVEQLTSWLLEEGIPVESERTLDIRKNHLIEELISFLKFLHSPIDNLSFASFILGEIFLKATGLSASKMHEFVFSLKRRFLTEKDFYIYTEFRRKFPKVWEKYFEGFFKSVGLYPLYEFVVTLYKVFGILDNFPDDQAYLMHFLELVKKEEDDQPDVASFIDYFENLEGEDLYIHITDSNSVKILTIHKAKGLEFAVVILPFLGMEVQVGSQEKDQQQSYVSKKTDSQMQLLRLKKKYTKFSPKLYDIYCEEYKKSFLSELNNIYVALTRPQKELYAFIPKKIGKSFNMVRFLIPDELNEQGERHEYSQEKSEKPALFKIPSCTYEDRMNDLRDEFLSWADLKNRHQKNRGEIMHFLLSLIGNLQGKDLDDEMKNALAQTATRFVLGKDFSEYKQLIHKIVEHKSLKNFFYVDEGVVFAEKEIVTAQGLTRRIDRLIIKKEEIWIIDYKSSHYNKGEQHQQIQEYKKIIQEMYPQHTVKGHLIYWDDLSVEEV